MSKFPFVAQLDSRDCGPACLAMIMKYYGRTYSLPTLRERSYINRGGVSLLGLSECAEFLGMRTIGAQLTYKQLEEEAVLPCIAHWGESHFIVVYRVRNGKVYVADPAHGLIVYAKDEFLKMWLNDKSEGKETGICLMLEPTPKFFEEEGESANRISFRFLYSYLKPYRLYIVQIMLGMLFGSMMQLIFPFLTQAMVDFGINNRDIGFITLVLVAQLVLNLSQAAVGFIQSWIMLHVTTRITIRLISDFLIKLMKLPIRFFDAKLIGDIMQRIGDHGRIQSFLTGTSISMIFSLVNLIIFAVVLAIYSLKIFAIFFVCSAAYIVWVVLFMKKRRELDYKRFTQASQNQSTLIQMISGIQEIKLNNCEKQKRWDWERIQARLFKVSIKGLYLVQYQQSGSMLINQVKNILISFYAAKAVIDGSMTLGMMIAVQYIIGQLNGPIGQIVNMFHATQDAIISMERLGEIHLKKDEESPDEQKIMSLPEEKSIRLTDLSYQYEGPQSEFVLKDLYLTVPENKVTAIVGVSGSGKTTLMKLMLGFYPPVKGEVTVGGVRFENISQRIWRRSCGVVLQDGFVFSDTIANNIALGDEEIDKNRVIEAAHTANIHEFIESLPLRYNTKIGMEGHGLSQGQRQRILIARAVYKNPAYLFFDEATNSLDTNNEEIIMKELTRFFVGKTVIVVAHRLSTVKSADQIVVLEKGRIIEQGNHEELIKQQGAYFQLVKNQLDLGK